MADVTRKSATTMTDAEWETFARALVKLKARIVNPTAAPWEHFSVYDQFVALHTAVLAVRTPGGGTTNMGHQSAGFGPWHREFLLRFERALRNEEPNAFIPYWNWTDHTGTLDVLFTEKGIGPIHGVVDSGYFAYSAPGTSSNTLPRPTWWPTNLEGWRVPWALRMGHGPALIRATATRPLATQAHIDKVRDAQVYEGGSSETWIEPDTGLSVMLVGGFRIRLEGGTGSVPKTHNYGHGWVGGDDGHMGDANESPNDPIFFLHHAFIDKVWADWQADGHTGDAFYPSTGFDEGHNLENSMWPWVGNATGYLPLRPVPGIQLPDFSGEPARTPKDVLDIAALGYEYA